MLPRRMTKRFGCRFWARYGVEANCEQLGDHFRQVFDVSTGGSYKKGGGYDFFTGRDGSAAFVTGKFDDEVNRIPLSLSLSGIS